MNMKKIITLMALSCLLAPGATILADTYDTGSWTSGDGNTEVSMTIDSSYTVTIPESLTLPHSMGYTGADNNVNVVSGATIPKNEAISVTLAAGKTFTAAYAGDSSATVPYKVKINEQGGIANTTDGAVNVLIVDSTTAHDAGAAATMKVGFDEAPNYKYSGTYSDSIQFNVTCEELPTPTPETTINIGGEPFKFVKQENGKYLVVQAGSVGNSNYNSGTGEFDVYYYTPYSESLVKGSIDSWFNNKFTSYTNAGDADTITLDGYTIYKTTLNGATSATMGSDSNDENVIFQNGYLSVPNGGTGTNAISAYAFAVSKADVNGQMATFGEDSTQESIRVANGSATWGRSPGADKHTAFGMHTDGMLYGFGVQSNIKVKAAFWISK